MGVAELLQVLLEATVATTAAVLLVLALRRSLRAMFGATVAYAAWALVPVATIAVLLPAATKPVMAAPMVQVLAATTLAMPAHVVASFDYRLGLALAWMLGTFLAVLWFARQQRGFRRGLGELHRRVDGLQQAEVIEGLPAAIGLWKPAIVLPADFDTRYSSEQRALMLAHERMHIVRGDLHANALTAGLRCVFWFNPLLHVAARHFRHDQELACDLRVIARHPHARRAYGEAMFKTQLALHPLPLGCHWGSHPLKERIAMLKQPVPSLSRWLGGSIVVVALTLAVGVTAWAAQPSKPAVRAAIPAPPVAPVPPTAPVSWAMPAPPAPPPAPAAPPVPPVAPAPPPPPPAYPKEALAQHVSGKVVLLIDVDAQGNATNVVVDQSEPAGVFDQASIEAASKWKFQPALEQGHPVSGRIRVPVEFSATGKPAPAEPKDSSRAPSAPDVQG